MGTAHRATDMLRAGSGIFRVRAGSGGIGRRVVRTGEWCSLPSQVDLTTEKGRMSASIVSLQRGTTTYLLYGSSIPADRPKYPCCIG
jgi:hypothetical protein